MLPCDLLTPSHIPYAGSLGGHSPNLVHLEAMVQHTFSEKTGACCHVSCLGHCGHEHILILNISSFITQSCIRAWYLS
jgi:hypothetical protein